MLLGRLFHSVGAIYEKARSPYVLVLLDGTSSSRIDDGLNNKCKLLGVGLFSREYEIWRTSKNSVG